MLGLLMLAREILRGARPSRALAKPSRVRELHYYTGLGDGIISHAEQRNELARDRQRPGRACSPETAIATGLRSAGTCQQSLMNNYEK